MEDPDVLRGAGCDSSTPALLAAMFAMLSVCASLLVSSRETLVAMAKENQIVQAFIVSTLVGGASLAVVTISRIAMAWVQAATFASVTITNKDESFDKVIDFIGKQGMVHNGALMALTHKKDQTWKDMKQEFRIGKRGPPKMEYRPANNNDIHVLTYCGHRIVMTRAKGETVIAGWERTPVEMETLTLSSWRGGVGMLKKFIDDAITASFKEMSDELTVFVLNSDWLGGWEKALSKKPRSLSTVILDQDLAMELVDDAQDFLRSADWYRSVGIPHRRGYLLYGPPGCGKTSFCQALAGELKLDICMLTLANKNLTDNDLAESLREAPMNSIVLLEDVDAVFVDRTAQTGANATGVTFSGLLNALDGVASQEGRLFFMTTNHVDKLDPALIRPGRCDVKVELRKASRLQAARLFERFYPDATERADSFAAQLPEYELSMAQLQGYLLEHKADPESAITHLPRLLCVSKPKEVDRMCVHEHLSRVGLERWASTFEFHGFHYVADLAGLKIDTVKAWSPLLRVDMLSARRLDLLLQGDERLMKEYQLADMATIKDVFLTTYAGDDNGRLRAPVDGTPGADRRSSGTPQYYHQASEGLRRGDLRTEESSRLSQLADALCSELQVDGRGIVSIWQLRNHLWLYEHNAEECVQSAPRLLHAHLRPSGKQKLVDDMTTYDVLRRMCLEKHAPLFEDEGFGHVNDLFGLDESALKALGMKGRDLATLTALFGAAEDKPEVLRRYVSPDQRHVFDVFVHSFANANGDQDGSSRLRSHAGEFASSICDDQGICLASFAQVDSYLKARCEHEPEKAATGARSELVDHVRPEHPPAPSPLEPDTWAYNWLKEANMDHVYDIFAGQAMCEKADFLSEPPLDLAQLAGFGISKAGEQRKILAMVKALRKW